MQLDLMGLIFIYSFIYFIKHELIQAVNIFTHSARSHTVVHLCNFLIFHAHLFVHDESYAVIQNVALHNSSIISLFCLLFFAIGTKTLIFVLQLGPVAHVYPDQRISPRLIINIIDKKALITCLNCGWVLHATSHYSLFQ